MRNTRKKELANEKKERMATGGGKVPLQNDDSASDITVDVITQSVVQEIPGAIDSDTVMLAAAGEGVYRIQNDGALVCGEILI